MRSLTKERKRSGAASASTNSRAHNATKRLGMTLASSIFVMGFFAQNAAAAGDASAGQAKAAVCAACHGATGNSINPEWPNLAGQKDVYLIAQMKAFRDGTRKNALMSPMAAALSDEDIENLAAFFSSQACE